MARLLISWYECKKLINETFGLEYFFLKRKNKSTIKKEPLYIDGYKQFEGEQMTLQDFIKLRETCEKRILVSLKDNHLYEKGLPHVVRVELLKAFEEFGIKYKKSFERQHRL